MHHFVKTNEIGDISVKQLISLAKAESLAINVKLNILKLICLISEVEDSIISVNYLQLVDHSKSIENIEYLSELCKLLNLLYQQQNKKLKYFNLEDSFMTHLLKLTQSCKYLIFIL